MTQAHAGGTTKHRFRPPARRRHGLTTLRRSVRELGGRVLDWRTSLGKTLAAWRTALIADLGGADAVSIQELAVVDLAVRTKLLLDSIDVWLLEQPTLINRRKRALLPVVRERTQLADALARYLGQLGLARRAPKIADLSTYVAQRYPKPSGSQDATRGDVD